MFRNGSPNSGSGRFDRIACLGLTWMVLLLNGVATWADDRSSPTDLSIDCQKRSRQYDFPICVVKYGPFEGIFAVDTGHTRTFALEPQELVENPEKDWRILDEQFQFASGLGSTKLIRGIPISVFGRPARLSDISYRANDPRNKGASRLHGFVGVQDLLECPFRMYLNRSICEPYTGNAADFKVSAPIFLDSANVPTIQVSFPALTPKSVVLDTGLGWFIAIPDSKIDIFVKCGIAKEAGTTEASNTMGLHLVKCYILREVKVGDYVFHDVDAVSWPHNRIGLGTDFFRHFDCVFDFPERQLRLKPEDDAWPKTVPPDASGLVTAFDEDGTLLVARVHSRNVVTAKVLRPDDVIMKFDGKSASEYTYLQIKDRLCEAGTTVPLRIRRKGQEFDVDLKLSYPFEYPPKWGDVIEPTDPSELFEKHLSDSIKKRDERAKKNVPR